MAWLPDHPNLYVGLVVHECLKQIHLLSIRDENSLKKLWDSEIERVESKLKNEGKIVATVLYKYAVEVPTVINVFISAYP